MEKKFGVRYTPLLDLKYYHPIKFCAIEAMHNLFLGTAKKVMKLLKKNGLLLGKDMALIVASLAEFKQGLMDEWVVENMKSNMGSLTATEWRQWTLVSSGYCLHEHIPQEYLEVWGNFVKGCRLLSAGCIDNRAHGLHHVKVLDSVDQQVLDREDPQ